MSSSYEFWLVADKGERLKLVEGWFFLNYSRIVNGIGTCQVGLPYDEFKGLFQVDRRLEIWRSPAADIPKRLDATYFLQRRKIYRRLDGVVTLELNGHSPLALLNRRVVAYARGAEKAFAASTPIDTAMMEVVAENFGADADTDRDYTQNGFFTVHAPVFTGQPEIDKAFANRNCLEVLRELHELSRNIDFTLYFDIVPVSPDQFEFQLFKDFRGQDQTQSGLVFSVENDNLEAPFYEESYFDMRNYVYVGGPGEGTSREMTERSDTASIDESIWNRREVFIDARDADTVAAREDEGDAKLKKMRTRRRFLADFLSIDPHSLYGVHWDLGDQVRVDFADMQFDVELKVVYITLDEDGGESVLARNEVGTEL